MYNNETQKKMCSDLQAEVRKVEIERKATQAKLEEALSVKTDYVYNLKTWLVIIDRYQKRDYCLL